MPLPSPDLAKDPEFVSAQVTEAQRYYLNLNPARHERLTVVCGGSERLRADYVVERATFPYWCVEFVAEGAGTLVLRGKRHALRPGIAFAYAPGVAHSIRNDAQAPMRKHYVHFAGPEAAKLMASTPIGKWAPVQIAAPQEVLEIFAALQRDALAEDDLRAELCAAHLRVLLLKIAQKGVPPQQAEPRALASYQRARRQIEERFLEFASAEEVARACHMTPVHLSRLFRRFAHTTPYQFLIRLKMNRAAESLLREGVMVKEVAEELEFSSQFQFSRVFKRAYGLAPEHFIRRSARVDR